MSAFLETAAEVGKASCLLAVGGGLVAYSAWAGKGFAERGRRWRERAEAYREAELSQKTVPEQKPAVLKL